MRFIFYTAFIFAILCFFQSDFFIARIALPLTANYYGLTLTVSNAGYDFLGNSTLFANDLVLMDDDGNELIIKRAELHLSLFPLLRGKYHISDATFREISLNVVNLPQAEKKITLPDPTRFSIGPIHMSNISISYGDRELYIRDFQFSGALANMRNTLYANGVLRHKNKHDLPLKLSLQWNRSEAQWLNNFTGSLELLPGTGKFFQRDLADSRFRLLFTGKATKDNLIHWRTTVETEGIGPTKDVLCRTTGYYDPITLKGTLNGEITGHFSEAEIRKGAGIFLGDCEVPIPENLTLQNFTGNVKFDMSSIDWDCEMTASIDRLWFEGKEYLSMTELHFSHAGSFSFRNPEFYLKKLNMTLKTDGASFSVKNKRDFIFFDDESGWHVDANNSELQIDINNIPAALMNIWLPLKFNNGVINGQYRIIADSALQRLRGKLALAGRDISIALSDKTFIDTHSFTMKMDLDSTGLEQIQSLAVKQCSIDINNRRNEKLLHADLNGTWYFQNSHLDLNGDMAIYTYAMTGAVHDPFIKEIHRYLKKNHYENVINRSKIRMSMNLNPEARHNQLKLQLDTSFNSFIFLGKQYKDHPLHLTVKAESSFSSSAMNINFPEFKLYSKKLTELAGSGKCSFPSCEAQFKLKLNSFTPEFWNSLAKLADHELDHMKYRSITGALDFDLSAKAETFRLQNGRLTMIPVDGALMELTLDREVFSLWKNLDRTDLPMTLTIKELPLNWWNCLLPLTTTFYLGKGIANGSAEVTAKNLCRDIFVSMNFLVKNASLGVRDMEWFPGDCTVTGNVAFPDYFRDIEFHATKIAGYHDNKEYISFLTHGFAGMETIRETALKFTIQKTTPRFLKFLCRDSDDLPGIDQFDMTGRFTYDADASYDKNDFTWDLQFRNIAFREKTPGTLVPLNGQLKMALQVLPDTFSFRNISLKLNDPEKVPRFDLRGDYMHKSGKVNPDIKYHLHSDKLDLQYLLRLLTNDPDEKASAAAVTTMSSGSLYNLIRNFQHTKFSVDLNNVTFTEHLNMTLKGKASFTEHGIKTDTIRWNVNQKGETDLHGDISILENGEAAYNGQIALRNISLIPFFDAFAVYTGKKMELLDGLKGEITDASLRFSGKGLSRQVLKDNLALNLQAKLKDLSIPPAAKDVSIIIKILLFPLEQIPVLINKIKYQPARLILQNIMGEHINVVTGKQNLNFSEGHLDINGRNDHFVVNKMLFRGPTLRFNVLNGYVQPFRNKMYLDTQIRIGTMLYPLVFDCPLDNPDYNLTSTLQRWLTIPQQIILPQK